MYFFYNSHKKDSTITIRVMCAIVFCILSFLWLYWFQADILAIAQYVLSGRRTHYDRLIGAVVITGFLFCVQQIISQFVRLGKHSYALTYLPSMLLLAILGDIYPEKNQYFTHHRWFLIVPVVLILWYWIIWVIKQIYSYDDRNERMKLTARQVWINLLEILFMMLFVALYGNTNAVMHYRAHIETALVNNDLEEALRTGQRSRETDAQLTMLRAYALSLKGELGERLFEYPVTGTSETLLPLGKGLERGPFLLSKDSMYIHFGAIPVAIYSSQRYFELLEKDSLATKAVGEYRLCGLLIDRKIDEFAQILPHYYDISAPLPKHYREAMILYTHLRSNPDFEYHDTVMDEDWNNFQELKRQIPNYNERKGKLNESYSTSYWYYYFYKE